MEKQFNVGSLVLSVTDGTRKEILGDAQGYRKISIRLYFPVEESSVAGKQKAQYVSDRKFEAMRKSFHIPRSAIKKFKAKYYENVFPIEGQKFPLLMFSHGYHSFVEVSSFLCSDIAANGYIVASVGHAYEAIENDYEDGSYDYFDNNIKKKMYPYGVSKTLKAESTLAKAKGTPEEIEELFLAMQKKFTPYIMGRVDEWKQDMLCALEVVKERYGRYIDFSNGIAASGHSLGGVVSYNLCLSNDEFACGLNLDGMFFGDYRNTVLKKPFYQFIRKEAWNMESQILLHKAAPVYTTVFSKMKHIGFTDLKLVVPFKFIVGKLDKNILYNTLLQCHLTFLAKYLKKEDIDLYLPNSPDIQTQVHF